MDGMEKEGIIISVKRIDAKIKVGKKLFDTKEEMFNYFIKLEEENKQLKISNNALTIQYEQDIAELKTEIKELKKQKIDWHTITCFDEPDEDGFITHDNPADVGYDFLIRLKGGTVTVDTLTECDQGVIFENYEWRDIESWAYIPERIRVVNSEKSRRN